MNKEWIGFTIEEIRKIKNTNNYNESILTLNNIGVAKQNSRERNLRFKKNLQRDRIMRGDKSPVINTNPEVPRDARLHIPQIPEEEEEEVEAEEQYSCNKSKPDFCPVLKSETIEKPSKINSLTIHTIEEETQLDISYDALVKFEERQKQMEEHNKKNKQLLEQVLADRKMQRAHILRRLEKQLKPLTAKKTQEEARRLNQIEEELKKLDQILSNDVKIIRAQIEIASLEYMESQKRYDKAEKEFLEAKLELFTHKERKEMLTNHLCTIIEQNELRKAKKISDLMRQLEMGIDLSAQPIEEEKHKSGIEPSEPTSNPAILN